MKKRIEIKQVTTTSYDTKNGTVLTQNLCYINKYTLAFFQNKCCI